MGNIFKKSAIALAAIYAGATLSAVMPQYTATVATCVVSAASKGWGYRKVKGKQPEVSSEDAAILHKYGGVYVGDDNSKKLYLTFDQGYENGNTSKILDVLKENKVPAAFFVTGHYLEKETELIRRMMDEGHIIGNHTINHPSLPGLSEDKLDQEVLGLNKIFKEKYGGGEMKYMRPPKGEYDETSLHYLQDKGFKTVMWSLAYVDWDVKVQKGVDYAREQVVNQLHNGAIILLHAVSVDNANALDSIIKEASEQGYTFESLDNLPE